MNNQFCTKPNVQMFLTWLFVHLCRNVFEDGNVARVFAKETSNYQKRASFLFDWSSLLSLPTATRRLALSEGSKRLCSGTDSGSLFLQLRSTLPANTPRQFKAERKNQAASCSAIHPLIQFFRVCIINTKSIIHQQLAIQEIGIVC